MDAPAPTRLLAFLSLIFLAACGGGGGGGSPSPPATNPPPPPPAPVTYSVGGNIRGLETGETIQLALNGTAATFDVAGPFQFDNVLESTVDYDVTLVAAPTGKVCEIATGSGSFPNADVVDVDVACGTMQPIMSRVIDLNQTFTVQRSSPTDFASFDGRVLFQASSSGTGRELWLTDGTEAGTVFVADTNPGLADGEPARFIDLGDGRAVFVATSADAGRELWVTDGTTVGTRMLQDIFPGTSGSTPENLVRMGDWVYFSAFEPTTGRELWRTNGDAVEQVIDLEPGNRSGAATEINNRRMLAVGGNLYFTGDDDVTDRQLWVTDGTAAGTRRLTDLSMGPTDSGPHDLVSFNGEVYFFSGNRASVNGEALYAVTTSSPARLVLDPEPGSTISINGMRAVAGALYFGTAGQVWRSDGTTAGSVGISIPTGVRPNQFVELGNKVVFQGAAVILETDGTVAGTREVADIAGKPLGLPGLVVFERDNVVSGREPWIYDGVTVQLLRDMNPGNADGLRDLSLGAVIDDRLYFPGDDGTSGVELWSSDGTTAGTQLVANVAGESNQFGIARILGVMSDTVYFEGRDDQQFDVWRSTGEIGNATRLTSWGGLFPRIDFARVAGDQLFFAMEDTTPTEGLWTVSEQDTAASLVPGAPDPDGLTGVLGSSIAYRAQNVNGGRDLVISDGTTAGTVRVDVLREPIGLVTASNGLGVLRASAVGMADDELWITDGTNAGTSQLATINSTGDSIIEHLTAFGDLVLFSAWDDVAGRELFVTNLTAQGTFLLQDTNPGPLFGLPRNITPAGGLAYLTANGAFWQTDGTMAGTLPAFTTSPTMSPPGLPSFGYFDGALYFTARTADAGDEPWVLTSPGSTPQQLADIRSGDESSSPQGYTKLEDFVFFVAQDDTTGKYHLWVTDGTPIGTRVMRNDVDVNAGVPMVAGDSNLYFAADDRATGQELWRVSLELEVTTP